MKDRVLIACVVILAAVSVGSMLMVWKMFEQGREVNQAILAKLEDLKIPQAASVEEPTIPAEWSKVSFKLTEGGRTDRPVAGARVRLYGKLSDAEKTEHWVEETDTRGMITFEVIRPGRHSYSIHNANGFSTNGKFTAVLGKPATIPITCPAPLPEAHVGFKIPWPEDLKDKGLIVEYAMSSTAKVVLNDTAWRGTTLKVFLEADGRILGELDNILFHRPPEGQTTPFASNSIYALDDASMPSREWGGFAAKYRFWYLRILVPAKDRFAGDRSVWRDIWYASYRDIEHPEQEAKPGRANEWTIQLPDSLIAHVREHLATKTTSQPASQPGWSSRTGCAS